MDRWTLLSGRMFTEKRCESKENGLSIRIKTTWEAFARMGRKWLDQGTKKSDEDSYLKSGMVWTVERTGMTMDDFLRMLRAGSTAYTLVKPIEDHFGMSAPKAEPISSRVFLAGCFFEGNFAREDAETRDRSFILTALWW